MNATPLGKPLVRMSPVASCALTDVSVKAPGQQVVRATLNPAAIAFAEINEPVARSATATYSYENFTEQRLADE
jgi:hypothetical protein